MGYRVRDVADLAVPLEMMDLSPSRLLHPKVLRGLSLRYAARWSTCAAEEQGVAPIDLLVVNLYPFESTVANGAPYDICVENIDIGGPAMIRAAAKNYASGHRRGRRSDPYHATGRNGCQRRRHIARLSQTSRLKGIARTARS